MLTFEEIIKKSQASLKKALAVELNRIGYKTKTKKGYIYAKGKLPVLLTAHLDTVHDECVKTICYSKDGRFIMSPEGIGGDDRCGVYMIMELVKKYKCHVLFCEDEEVGGVGAREFTRGRIKPKVNYIIGLDRRGENDAVFYDCDNPEFTEFVEGFGFKENFGSFSDISTVAPHLGIAAVNISSGYFSEHTLHEYIDMDVVNDNIMRVGKMIETKSKKFEYIESYRYKGSYGSAWKRHYEDDYAFGNYYGSMYNYKPKGKTKTTTYSYKDFGKLAYGHEDDGSLDDSGLAGYESLMEIPDSAYIRKANGEFMDNDGSYYIDSRNRVYEYLFDIDVAIESEGYDAFSASGILLRYDEEQSTLIEVMHYNDAIMALELAQYDRMMESDKYGTEDEMGDDADDSDAGWEAVAAKLAEEIESEDEIEKTLAELKAGYKSQHNTFVGGAKK